MTRSLNLGMRILSFVLCLLCLVSLAQPFAVVEATESEEVLAQTLTTIVRNKASNSSAIIGQMENGTMVKVLGKKKDFYKVDCYGRNGYIAKSQIVHSEDGNYYISCDPESSNTRVLTYTAHADALSLRHSLLKLGKKNLGYRYRYGGTRPGGFDCSGLMLYLFNKHGINLHRTAATQMQDGVVVPRDGLQVGDLLFFYEPGRTYPASHVGIYIGDNKMIHSGSRGTEIADLDIDYYVKYYEGARRVINTAAAQLEVPASNDVSGLLTTNSVTGRTAN